MIASPQPAPRLSVIIPTFRRPGGLTDLLDRLLPHRQGLPPSTYEVIVSDDDPAAAGASEVRSRFPQVRFVEGPRRGPGANRNCGARVASGEWLVFTDDDCRPASGWLAAMGRAAESDAVDVIEGKIVAPEKRDTIFIRDLDNLRGGVFWSANLAVRRLVFERLGGFDPDFGQAGGEDMELAHRFRTNQLRTVFAEDAVVYHLSHVLAWRDVLEFVFRLRWHTLYVMKTCPDMSPDKPARRVVFRLIRHRIVDLFRVTWRDLRSFDRRYARSTIGQTVLNWALFPVVLPYLVYWDSRFRRMLRERRTGSVRG